MNCYLKARDTARRNEFNCRPGALLILFICCKRLPFWCLEPSNSLNKTCHAIMRFLLPSSEYKVSVDADLRQASMSVAWPS